jgi:hypothetical protein
MPRIISVMFVIGVLGFAAVVLVPRVQGTSWTTFFAAKCPPGHVSKDCQRKYSSR